MAEFQQRASAGGAPADLEAEAKALEAAPASDLQAEAPAALEVDLEAEAPAAPAPAAPATNGNGNPLCPFCRQAILPGGEGALAPASCDLCSTPYHAECWEANGGRCSVYGCRSRAANGAAPADLGGIPAEVADLEAPAAPAPDLRRPRRPAPTPAPAAPAPAPATTPAPAAPVIYPPAGGGGSNRRPAGPARPARPLPSPAAPAAPNGRPAREEETPAEAAARAELSRLRFERQAAEERARTAEADARRRRLWEEEHRAESEAARRLEEERAALALREERRRAIAPKPGWKVIGGLFLGGIVAILLAKAFGAGAEAAPNVIGIGEAAGVIFGVIWWRLEVSRWSHERQEREAEARRAQYLEARPGGAPADLEAPALQPAAEGAPWWQERVDQ